MKNFTTKLAMLAFMSGALFSSHALAQDVAISFTPENGSSVDALEEFRLTFDGATNVTPLFGDYSFLTSLYNGETIYPSLNFWSEVSEGTLVFYFNEPLHEAGVYELICPEGAFSVSYPDGSSIDSPEITYTINIEGKVIHKVQWTTAPKSDEDGIISCYEFSEIKLTFNEDATVELGDPDGSIMAYFNYSSFKAPKIDSADITRIYYSNPVVEMGTLGLLIPEGQWLLTFPDGQEVPTPLISIYIHIDPTNGVETITFDGNEKLTIYNLQGQCLAKDAPQSIISSLPAGTYVINGKKITIR